MIIFVDYRANSPLGPTGGVEQTRPVRVAITEGRLLEQTIQCKLLSEAASATREYGGGGSGGGLGARREKGHRQEKLN